MKWSINLKAMRSLFSINKADLFSAVCTVLGIFILNQFDVRNLFLFMVLVVVFTVFMDFIYKNCR
jgi:hypothetical protein